MRTILIVDDDIISRKVISHVCKSLGYNVIESEDGEEAFKIMEQRKIEILITDWIMPKMDGISLCEKIRNTPSDVRPFIFLITGKKKGLHDFAEAVEAGADDVVYKPVDYYVFRNQLHALEETLAEAK